MKKIIVSLTVVLCLCSCKQPNTTPTVEEPKQEIPVVVVEPEVETPVVEEPTEPEKKIIGYNVTPDSDTLILCERNIRQENSGENSRDYATQFIISSDGTMYFCYEQANAGSTTPSLSGHVFGSGFSVESKDYKIISRANSLDLEEVLSILSNFKKEGDEFDLTFTINKNKFNDIDNYTYWNFIKEYTLYSCLLSIKVEGHFPEVIVKCLAADIRYTGENGSSGTFRPEMDKKDFFFGEKMSIIYEDGFYTFSQTEGDVKDNFRLLGSFTKTPIYEE